MERAIRDDTALSGFSRYERDLVELLIQAARAAIRADHDQAPYRYQALLLYILDNLTNPLLRVGRARDASNLTGINRYSKDFERIVGKRPRDYIEHHRMRLAQKILRHTEASIFDVACAVGYTDQNVFSRRYGYSIGHTPKMEPRADPNETRLLIEKLRISSSASHNISVNHHESNIISFSEGISELSRDQAVEYFLQSRDNLDLQHFNLILEKSKLEGRASRQRGEELCEIALDALRVIELSKRKEYLDEKVLCYAYLANTRRLMFDMEGARKTFRTIDEIMPREMAPTISLKISYFKAYFLWWQRDADSAIKLLESMLPEVRLHTSHKQLTRVLRLSGELYLFKGHQDRAIPVLEEAVRCTQYFNDAYVAISSYYELSLLHARMSNVERATELLGQVRLLQEEANRPDSGVYISLLEAMISSAKGNNRAAEVAFLEAREGFADLGWGIHAALTSLELSNVYLELKEPDRAISMAISSIPFISQYSAHREATSALTIIQQASATSTLNKSVIRRAFHHLEVIRMDPTSRFIKTQ